MKNKSRLKVLIMDINPHISKSMEQVLNKPAGDEDAEDLSSD